MAIVEMISLREVRASDKPIIYQWRNQPDVRMQMFTQHEIGLEEHEKWFLHLAHDDSCLYRIIENSGRGVGLCYLTGIDWDEPSCSLGIYIGDPRSRGASVGAAALYLLLDIAFLDLELEVVSAQFLLDNRVAESLYSRVGMRGVSQESGVSVYQNRKTVTINQSEWSKVRIDLFEDLLKRGLLK